MQGDSCKLGRFLVGIFRSTHDPFLWLRSDKHVIEQEQAYLFLRSFVEHPLPDQPSPSLYQTQLLWGLRKRDERRIGLGIRRARGGGEKKPTHLVFSCQTLCEIKHLGHHLCLPLALVDLVCYLADLNGGLHQVRVVRMFGPGVLDQILV